MAPAFSSRKQAAAFAALLLLLMLLPVLTGKSLLPPRPEIYSSVSWRLGPYPFLHQKIFEEKGDADIVFAGSSRLFAALDVPCVRQEFSRKLGREATVFSLGWPYPGFDAVYFIVRDLLAHRKVKMLVVNEEFRAGNHDGPHRVSFRWFRWGDDAYTLDGLPLKQKFALYAGAVLGMPRNLVGLLRPNLPVAATSSGNYWETFYHAPPFATTLGGLTGRIGYNYDPDFQVYRPAPALQPSDSFIYSAASNSSFKFTGPPTPPYQLHFAKLLAELTKANGVKLVLLHLPDTGDKGAVVEEREDWAAALGVPMDVVGIPPDKLFGGMKQEDITKLFFDGGHLNENGEKYFTPLVTPALLKIYESKPDKR